MPDAPSPSRFVIKVENCPLAFSPGDVTITSAWLDLPRLVQGKLRREEKAHVFVPEGRFAEQPAREARFKKSMTVVAEDPSPRKLLAMAADLRRYACDYLFTPETIGDGTMAMMAASLDVPVRLACREDWPEDVLGILLDYFLGSPVLTAPIEPFYSLAGAIGQQREVTLWEVFDEVLGRNWFVDSQGRVSLGERWATRGRFFGAVTDSGNGFRASELWSDLSGLKERIFASQAACAFCTHYPYCGGFWSTAERADEACETWRRLMDRLVAAYRQERAATREETSDA